MSRAEWLRTFLAVYRTGSVTVGARSRGLSQPAASQHLGALSRAAGGPVFVRVPRGVTPTALGRELYARIAEPLDRLETVFAGLDGGRVQRARSPVRIGSAVEVFEGYLLPRLAAVDAPLVAEFGIDEELVDQLLAGELDVTVTSTRPARRTALTSVAIGERTFVLVAAPELLPDAPVTSPEALADWLARQRWLGYSRESPVARTFWRAALGRPFEPDVALVAPDLRTVLAAAELGMGVGLLPRYVCERALEDGRVVEPYGVTDLVPSEPWFATTRRAEAASGEVAVVLAALTAGGTAAGPTTGSRRPRSGPPT